MVKSVFSIPLGTAEADLPAASRRAGASEFSRQFIAGPENQLARLAAESFEDPDAADNPLVFYGPTGRGKSLLAVGLAQRFQSRHPQAKTFVTTGADFGRAFASAVEGDGVADFRRKRHLDSLLVIDGVHELSGKKGAQQELAALIDHHVKTGRRVVITCREYPGANRSLASGLAGRLCGGLTVPLESPSFAARFSLIRHYAKSHEIELSPRVVEQLAGSDHENGQVPLTTPLKINSALQQLRQMSAAAKRPIDNEMAAELFAELSKPREPALADISRLAARHFQISVRELRGPSRRRTVVRARGIAMLLARRLTQKSLGQIGRHFGGRDHTTVLHACRKTESLAGDGEITETINELTSRLAAVEQTPEEKGDDAS